MAEPTPLYANGVTPKVSTALHVFDRALVEAVNAAHTSGVPAGLVVGLLHALAHAETQRMLGGALSA